MSQTSHFRHVFSVENPEQGQGKSSIAWIICGELARRKVPVMAVDADIVNHKTGDPVISGYVDPDVFTGFDVRGIGDMHKTDFNGEQHIVMDGSRNPPVTIKEIIAAKSSGVIIPIRSGRGYEKGIVYAREVFRKGVPICFVLNDFIGQQADRFQGVLDAFDATLIDLGDGLRKVQDMTGTGRLPWHDKKEFSRIGETAKLLVDDLLSWADACNKGADVTKLEAVSNG